MSETLSCHKLSCPGGGLTNIFGIFTPIPRKMIQFDEHIFQMGVEKPPTSCTWLLITFASVCHASLRRVAVLRLLHFACGGQEKSE